jgi:hypothetical protein
MTSADLIRRIEESFKGLTGSNKISYNTTYPYNGWGAVVKGREGENWYEATLVRAGSENPPKGEIYSLKFYSGTGTDDVKTQVATKIDTHWGFLSNEKDEGYMDERIKRAIDSQKLLKNIIGGDEGVGFITGADSLPYDKLKVENLCGKGVILNILRKDKKGKAPLLPVKIHKYFGDQCKTGSFFDKSFVEVEGLMNDDMKTAIPQLEFQTKKFESIRK